MYGYIRNTYLHYIDELELLCIALGFDCYMMNVIQQVTEPMPTNYSILFLLSCYCYKIIAITVTVTIAVVTTIKTIKLLCY